MPGLSLSMSTLMQQRPLALPGGFQITAATVIAAATVISA